MPLISRARLTLFIGSVRNHQARQAGDFVHFVVERDAFLQILELDGAADFGDDRVGVRIPLADGGADLDLRAVFDAQLRAVDDGVTLVLAALVVDDGDLARAVHGDEVAVLGANRVQVDVASRVPAFFASRRD